MLERINNYINDKEFRYTIYEDKIHIVNYEKILSLEDTFISIQSKKQIITIRGKYFSLRKLLDNEILIMGILSKIEVFYEE